MGETKIEWTHAPGYIGETWNPTKGCNRVSEGCRHCYAERMAKRLIAMGQEAYAGTVDEHGRWTGRINIDERAIDMPLRHKKPRCYFVDSMSDLFHENISFKTLDRIFAVMAITPRHRYLVLTKRPRRAAKYLSDTSRASDVEDAWFSYVHGGDASCPFDWPLPNVGIGVSVEDQKTAQERLPWLINMPAGMRFVSYEPALGPVDFLAPITQYDLGPVDFLAPITQYDESVERRAKLHAFRRSVDWIICGGESGPDPRPMHPEWARSARDQCAAAGVPFFFKQWGQWTNNPPGYPFLYDGSDRYPRHVFPDGKLTWRVGKKAAGHLLDGREHSEFPEWFSDPVGAS